MRRIPGRPFLPGLALALTVMAVPSTAIAAPPDDTRGRGPEPRTTTADLLERDPDGGAANGLTQGPAATGDLIRGVDPLPMPSSYPSQPTLRTYPDASEDDGGDAADAGELVAYDELAPQLNEWMAESDRISVQVVGKTTGGRDLYLVTVTAPETRRETQQQTAWRNEIRDDPAAAAQDEGLQAAYKTPIWFSANIHGNEWEGTDASMQYIEDLVTAPESAVGDLLEGHRLYFSLTLNPDGRTIGQRATSVNLDANRDMITLQTPEATSFVRTAQAVQALYAADLHGYTGVLQVEPCGPPHGDNYEYDLFVPHAYASALRVEQDVVAADIPGNTYFNVQTRQVVQANTGPDTAHIKIPYRDTPSGWDDFPPIFTAQYAAFHGAVTSTVELPIGRTAGRQTPGNARINTAVAKQTISSLVDYVTDNSDDMLAGQVEMFRRGMAGEQKQQLTEANVAGVPGPDQWTPLWDSVDDQNPLTLPRAYVVPMGEGQRSESDAKRLVGELLFHGVEVSRLDRATTLGGTRYLPGSYVVDMHQPLRGLVNALLDVGADISDKVPSMYDISGWSWAYLWGADVAPVGETTDSWSVRATPVTRPLRTGSMDSAAEHLTFDLAGVEDFRAFNGLLEDGVEAEVLDDGTPVFDRADRTALQEASRQHDITVRAASPAQVAALDDPDTKTVDDVTVAYSGTQDDLLSLTELGFDDLVPVSAARLTEEPSLLDGVDALWVGSSLSFGPTQGAGRDAVTSYVASGRPVLGRGTAGAAAANAFGVVQATAVQANSSSNGIVAVDTRDGGVLAPFAQDSAFVYPAVSFTGLGPDTTAEQSYAADPLLAGHWRGTTPTNSEAFAAGKPSVVSGEAASGAKGLVFGTSVFFRTHPKGGLGQAAQAIVWSLADDD